jgi:hypothetical protein
MHGMSWSGFVTGAVDACMMSMLLRARWTARPEAASAGTPLGQDGRPSTCAISGPRRPQGRLTRQITLPRASPSDGGALGPQTGRPQSTFFTAYYETRSLYGASSRGIPVKKIAPRRRPIAMRAPMRAAMRARGRWRELLCPAARMPLQDDAAHSMVLQNKRAHARASEGSASSAVSRVSRGQV